MSVVGADIGCKKTIICKWIKDPYNLNPDGIPFCILNESQKDIYKYVKIIMSLRIVPVFILEKNLLLMIL